VGYRAQPKVFRPRVCGRDARGKIDIDGAICLLHECGAIKGMLSVQAVATPLAVDYKNRYQVSHLMY
jgi:hypothetical protein